MAGITLVSQGTIAASGSPAFGAATTAGNLLVAWVGSNGSTASATITTAASGWVQADAGGGAFSWSALWYKPGCGASETAPVFSDPHGNIYYSQLAEFSGAAAVSPVDQHGNAYSGGGNSLWGINPAADANAGDLVCVSSFWNGANSGGTISVAQFTDSTGTAITRNFQQQSSGGLYFSSLWGVTGNTGGDGDFALLSLSPFNAGGGAMASFSPASPVLFTLTVPAQALPVTWLDFPYPPRTVQGTGGTPPYTWAVTGGSLPAGLSLSSAGLLSGSSVTASGAFPFTVQVTDSAARTATGNLSVTVNPAPPGTSLTTSSSTTGLLGPYPASPLFPSSSGGNCYVAANSVGPISVTENFGAYDLSTFYFSIDASPAGTGQVQTGPCSSIAWNTWGTGGWNGGSDTPLSALSSLTATFDVTSPASGTWELCFDIWTGYVGEGGSNTTVAAGSNGGQISTIASWTAPSPGVLSAASTSGFPSAGTLIVQASGSATGAFVTYTGIAGSTFTGCAYVSGAATGTVATGNWIYQANVRDIMLWLDTSAERGTGGAILHTPNLTFGIPGQVFDFYYYPTPYPNGPVAGAELIFILQGAGGSGTFAHMSSGTVDVLGPLNWLVSQGYDLGNSGSPSYTPFAVPPYLSLILFGWEVCNTDTIPGAAATTQSDIFITNSFAYNYALAGAGPAPVMAARPGLVNRAVTVPVRIGR